MDINQKLTIAYLVIGAVGLIIFWWAKRHSK